MRFWLNHLFFPVLVFVSLVFLFKVTDFDLLVAQQFFNYDLKQWYFGESWWTVTFIHDWGKDLIVLVFLVSLLSLVSSLLMPSKRQYSFIFLYAVLVILFSTGIVALIKHYTNINCPWDTNLFNGEHPYFNLFSHKMDKPVNGRCFPGGHSSGGFSLLLFYFMFRDINKRYAKILLVTAVSVGFVFGLGQWARGAHFVSHDMWSAMICWLVSLTLYRAFYKERIVKLVTSKRSRVAGTVSYSFS